jgi:CheY-like chemotaxis protein
MVRALEMGASDYLARPFAPLTLMAHVRRLISRGAVAQFSGSEMPVVLVVSDSTRDLLVAGTSLRERGRFRTYLGIGGEDGVKRFEEIAPDVLILDFDMADMKGTAFLDAVAASGGPRKTAVIAATREREPQGGESLAARGVKGVVRKPFEALTLALDVERILGIPENAKRAADASDHLNAEILRVMRSSREAAERGGRKKGA